MKIIRAISMLVSTMVITCGIAVHGAENAPGKEPPKPPTLLDRLAKVLQGEDVPFTIVTRVYIRPGAEDEFDKIAARVSKASAVEKGCQVYEFHRDLEKPSNYTLIETWSGIADIKAHLQQAHTKEIQTAMSEMGTTPRHTEIFSVAVSQ